MSIFRTIAMFIYLFGYMIVHYGVLRRAERALAAGDTQLVEELVNKHIPHWSRGILKVTGVSLSVEGLENIPKDTPCVFVGNHRSYYDIPLLLASLDKPHGILAKEELEKIPLLNRWMKLLGCVFVQRDDLRASVRALNDATAPVLRTSPHKLPFRGHDYAGKNIDRRAQLLSGYCTDHRHHQHFPEPCGEPHL